MPTSGETAEGVATASALLIADVQIGADIIVVRLKTDDAPVFVSYLLNTSKRQIMRLATGASVSHIYPKDIARVCLSLPSSELEQQKIANFLSAVDEKIEQLEQKRKLLELYKKGLMQKLFSQELRFKDEQGRDYPEWETKRLKQTLAYEQPADYIVENSEYHDTFNTPVLTPGKTFLLGYTNETQGIFKEKLPVIIFDDFTTAFKFVDYPFKVKSAAIKILLARQGENIRFIYYVMTRIRFPIGEHKRYYISEFQHEKICYPSHKEQTKIADFLSAVDEKKEHLNKQIQLSQIFKKGLLQQLFV